MKPCFAFALAVSCLASNGPAAEPAKREELLFGETKEELFDRTIVVGGETITILPDGLWLRVPIKVLEILEPGTPPGCVAGFIIPQTEPNVPRTCIRVRIAPPETPPQIFLDVERSVESRATETQSKILRPAEGLRIGVADRAVIIGEYGKGGRTDRSYAFPTSKGFIIISVSCSTEAASLIFPELESFWKDFQFPDEGGFNAKWIAEFRKLLPKPKKVY